jgi:hypothetical protein
MIDFRATVMVLIGGTVLPRFGNVFPNNPAKNKDILAFTYTF